MIHTVKYLLLMFFTGIEIYFLFASKKTKREFSFFLSLYSIPVIEQVKEK
jgi:hypothetical protein